MATQFQSKSVGRYVGGKYTVEGFNIYRYEGHGTATEVVGWPNGRSLWPTKEDADAAAVRAQAGDEAGMEFAAYSND